MMAASASDKGLPKAAGYCLDLLVLPKRMAGSVLVGFVCAVIFVKAGF